MLSADIDDGGLADQLDEMVWRCANPEQSLRDGAEVLVRRARANFEEGGKPPWRPVQRTGRPLVLTGRLAASVRSARDEPAVETTVPYAGVHQYGTSRVPARPFLTVQPADADEIAEIVADYVTEPVEAT